MQSSSGTASPWRRSASRLRRRQRRQASTSHHAAHPAAHGGDMGNAARLGCLGGGRLARHEPRGSGAGVWASPPRFPARCCRENVGTEPGQKHREQTRTKRDRTRRKSSIFQEVQSETTRSGRRGRRFKSCHSDHYIKHLVSLHPSFADNRSEMPIIRGALTPVAA